MRMHKCARLFSWVYQLFSWAFSYQLGPSGCSDILPTLGRLVGRQAKLADGLLAGRLRIDGHGTCVRTHTGYATRWVCHCNPLQGNYRVELLHREIPVFITGNEFTEYNFLLFWLHFFPCFNNIEIVALVPVMCTGNCQFILQGLKGCFKYPVIFTGSLQGRITTQGDPCSHYWEWVCSVVHG